MPSDPYYSQRSKVSFDLERRKRAILTHEHSIVCMEISRAKLDASIESRKAHIVCNLAMIDTLQTALNNMPSAPLG